MSLSSYGTSRIDPTVRYVFLPRRLDNWTLNLYDTYSLLLPTLSIHDPTHHTALTCLVTGNLEPIAWLKMSHLGLLDCFTEPQFGGFGTDFCSGNSAEMWRDRAVFVKIAGEKAQKIAAARGMPAVTKRIHVGDTPYDIQAAVEAGAFALGVTTGIFDKAKLESYMDVSKGQGVVVSGLQDIETVIKACGEAV